MIKENISFPVILTILLFFIAILPLTFCFNKEKGNNIFLEKQDTLISKITTYNAEGNYSYNGYYITSSKDTIIKENIMANNWCAISRNLMDSLNLKFDDTIHIIGHPYEGTYIIKDLTNKRIKNTIDVLIPKGQKHTMYYSKVIIKKRYYD